MKVSWLANMRGWLYFTGILVVLVSCEDETKQIKTKYLVEYNVLSSLSTDQVKNKIILASILYPEFDSLIPAIRYGVDIYKVVYKTHFNGNEIYASGLVCLPRYEDYFPILSFQNGTNTCLTNAPSENADNRFYSLLTALAGNGYIFTLPDYIGFGESDYILHPYFHRESSNSAVIDLLIATRELLTLGRNKPRHNGELYLMGYSQGGWATLSVLNELEEHPVSEIYPVASACGASSYNLIDMCIYVISQEEYGTSYYIPYFIESRRQNGIMDETLSLYFNEPYATTIPKLFNGTLCNGELNAEFPSTIKDLLTPNMVEHFEDGSDFATLREQLQINSVPVWNLQSYLRLYHSTGDRTIPYTQSEVYYNQLINAGLSPYFIDLVMIENDSLDHDDAVISWGVDAIEWFNSLK